MAAVAVSDGGISEEMCEEGGGSLEKEGEDVSMDDSLSKQETTTEEADLSKYCIPDLCVCMCVCVCGGEECIVV